MKRLLLILFLLSSCPLYAQYGVRVGPSLSTFRTDAADQGYLLGYRFGTYLEVAEITKRVVFSPEIAMSLLGSEGEEDNEISLLYLQAPLLLRYYIQSPRKGLYVESGPALGYLLSAEDESRSTTDDVEDNFTPFEVFLPVGLGYNAVNWGVTATYHIGLQDISDVNSVSVRNSSFSILVTLPLFNGSFGGY
ncbi:outer membrane beta-barrel protein [Roseivirga sp. BDSF3-8]|uniref:outer membrane beta-barrel protein n=1 Tax=Roseivirga sp. BDSF3-8 TaxID=3241598 RepID=UPI003531955A